MTASQDDQTPMHPLLFEPIYKEKVWGGRAMEQLGRSLPGDETTKIGESWELADLATTSVSGGGGGAERSRIANGELAGLTLHDAIEKHGKRLIGDVPLTDDGGFPLLLKFLDAAEHLSVQVHPSPDYAAAHDDAFLKSEAWYILHREPGAVIYKGVKPGVTQEQFRKAIEANELQPLLLEVPVEPGQCHYLPSGTCHALGAGVLVAEVQTPSDTTFRVYDWGRTGRELHIEQALQCIDFGPPDVSRFERGTKIGSDVSEITRLVTCEFFDIDRVVMQGGEADSIDSDQPALWMFLGGQAKLTGGFDPVALTQGKTVFLPPHLKEAKVHCETESTWLEVTFPQASMGTMA